MSEKMINFAVQNYAIIKDKLKIMATTDQIQEAPLEQVLNNQEAFLLKYKNAIVGGVLAVLLIVAGVICYKNFYAAPREDKASTALAKAQVMFANQEFDKALKGDKGVQGFIAIADEFSGTDAANLAHLYAGLCYAHTEKWQEAVTELEKYSTHNDALISPQSQAALGDAYANTGNVDKAIDCFKKAASLANDEAADGINNSTAANNLIKAARLLESQNKNEEALKIYQDIKAKYVNSPVLQEIDKYIERVSK